MPEIIELRYELLKRKLAALEAAGVDDWDGYNFAMEAIIKEEELEEERNLLLYDIAEALCEGVEEPAGSGCGYGFSQDALENAESIIRSRKVIFNKE